jgi:tRNA U34 5-carboxymethylaminomethyl modifying enzyme MnmG/GidA
MKGTKRKIIKIESIKRNPKDFLTKTKTAKYELRAKYANRKIDIPLADKLTSTAKSQNTCICCSLQASQLIYLEIKGGGTKLERYCPSCFDRLVNLDKMVMNDFDNSHLVIVKPSEGATRPIESWKLDPNYKKWTHIK